MAREPSSFQQEPSNGDLMRMLGGIEANQQTAIREADKASESRKQLYEKIEETNSVVQTIATQFQEHVFQLRTTTDIAISARDGMTALRDLFDREVAPVMKGTATFRKEIEPLLKATRTVRNWAAFFAVLAGSGVLSAGAIVAFFNEAAKAWLRHWLGI